MTTTTTTDPPPRIDAERDGLVITSTMVAPAEGMRPRRYYTLRKRRGGHGGTAMRGDPARLARYTTPVGGEHRYRSLEAAEKALELHCVDRRETTAEHVGSTVIRVRRAPGRDRYPSVIRCLGPETATAAEYGRAALTLTVPGERPQHLDTRPAGKGLTVYVYAVADGRGIGTEAEREAARRARWKFDAGLAQNATAEALREAGAPWDTTPE